MKDAICVVEVGVHPAPYWTDANGRVTGPVCTRHRDQLDERAAWDDEFGPYDWQPYDPARAALVDEMAARVDPESFLGPRIREGERG